MYFSFKVKKDRKKQMVGIDYVIYINVFSEFLGFCYMTEVVVFVFVD